MNSANDNLSGWASVRDMQENAFDGEISEFWHVNKDIDWNNPRLRRKLTGNETIWDALAEALRAHWKAALAGVAVVTVILGLIAIGMQA